MCVQGMVARTLHFLWLKRKCHAPQTVQDTDYGLALIKAQVFFIRADGKPIEHPQSQ